jgi:hypothetical protein
VGTELAALSSDPSAWLALIHAVPDHCHGLLVYAANFVAYRSVQFRDVLELIRIDHCWLLALRPTHDASAHASSWAPILRDFGSFAISAPSRLSKAGRSCLQRRLYERVGQHQRAYLWSVSHPRPQTSGMTCDRVGPLAADHRTELALCG